MNEMASKDCEMTALYVKDTILVKANLEQHNAIYMISLSRGIQLLLLMEIVSNVDSWHVILIAQWAILYLKRLLRAGQGKLCLEQLQCSLQFLDSLGSAREIFNVVVKHRFQRFDQS